LHVAVSTDGLDWCEVLVLETEPVTSGYAYPAVIQASNGNVHVTYTHDRRRITHVEIDPTELKQDACLPQ
jgi:predicted neuraminidase